MKKSIKRALTLVLALAISLTMAAPIYAATTTGAETKALALKKLGLFKGVSDTEFDLDRAPSRIETIVMLIRVLGQESEALKGNWSHPFSDVAPWADKYIGYAYEKGLTKGISKTEFGTGIASSDIFLTFMLRALGYNDSAGDFKWNEPDALASRIGILPKDVNISNFMRADAVLVSWAALEANIKESSQTLANKLISADTFTVEDYSAAQQLINKKATKVVIASTVEELKAALEDPEVTDVTISPKEGPVVVTKEITIQKGTTVTVDRGKDFYIEGILTNNGIIKVMGANSIDEANDFINYSVMSVQNGGKLVNNGEVKMLAAELEDTSDHGPIGGQLRLIGGNFENSGTVVLQAGKVNTHGGVAGIVDGTFINNNVVVLEGFLVRIDSGNFINNSGAEVINNSHIFVEEEGAFTNNGTLSGSKVNE